MVKIYEAIPDFEKGFPWEVYNKEIEGCPLKHMVQSILYGYKNKFNTHGCKNQSILDRYWEVTDNVQVDYQGS